MGWESDHFMDLRRLLMMITLSIVGCSSLPPQKELTHTERASKLLEIANGALAEGDSTGALQTLIKAEQEDATLPEIYHSKALAFFSKHDVTSAIANAQKAVKMKFDYSDANNTLGKLFIETGKYDTAIPYLLNAAQDPLYRDTYKAWTNLGILKYRQGYYQQSKEFLDQAILANPLKSCIAYYYRGHIGLKDLQITTAIENYTQATKKFCTSFGDAYLALGLAYQQNRQYDSARKAFLAIQTLYPNTLLADQAIDYLKYIP